MKSSGRWTLARADALALAWLALAAASALAQPVLLAAAATPAQAAPQPAATIAPAPIEPGAMAALAAPHCKSLVLRHCPGQAQAPDDDADAVALEQSRWAALGDGDEIIVTAQRVPPPGVREALQSSLGGPALPWHRRTRAVGDGTRCTGNAGPYTCSRSGNTLTPRVGTDPDRADWVF